MGLFSKLATPVTVTASGQHLAEHCRDDYCMRLPCRMFRAGYRKGFEEGHAAGFADGYASGYSAGYSAGSSSCSCGG